jgi:hypothetical protein
MHALFCLPLQQTDYISTQADARDTSIHSRECSLYVHPAPRRPESYHDSNTRPSHLTTVRASYFHTSSTQSKHTNTQAEGRHTHTHKLTPWVRSLCSRSRVVHDVHLDGTALLTGDVHMDEGWQGCGSHQKGRATLHIECKHCRVSWCQKRSGPGSGHGSVVEAK